MRFALGCALTAKQLLCKFPYKKVSYKGNHAKGHTRSILAALVFTKCFQLIIDDIIQNSIVFMLPQRGAKKACIKINTIEGENFTKLFKVKESWKKLNYIQSGFKMYNIHFKTINKNVSKLRAIYIKGTVINEMIEKINSGFVYKEGKEKTIEDYIPELRELFPQITKKDLRFILKYAFIKYYDAVTKACDVIIKSISNSFWVYTGQLKYDSLEWFDKYCFKLAMKIKFLYYLKKYPWDGYYYFALSNQQYDETFKQKKKKRGCKCTFKNIMLHTLKDVCSLLNSDKRYICRIPYKIWIKDSLRFNELATSKAELITIREPLKFKDILVSENEYDLL